MNIVIDRRILCVRLMDIFNKTGAAVFPRRLCFLGAFPFISLMFCLIIFYCKYNMYKNYNPRNMFPINQYVNKLNVNAKGLVHKLLGT